MSLNSEPIPEENDLLRMIDEGIHHLRSEEESHLSLDTEQIRKSEEKKND